MLKEIISAIADGFNSLVKKYFNQTGLLYCFLTIAFLLMVSVFFLIIFSIPETNSIDLSLRYIMTIVGITVVVAIFLGLWYQFIEMLKRYVTESTAFVLFIFLYGAFSGGVMVFMFSTSADAIYLLSTSLKIVSACGIGFIIMMFIILLIVVFEYLQLRLTNQN